MIKALTDLLIADISTVTWIDKIGGVVNPMPLKVRSGDGTTDKIVPGAYNYNQTGCNSGRIETYTPDTKYKSVSYFEILSPANEISSNSRYSEHEVTLRFVSWLNLKKINQSLTPPTDLPYEIMSVIPRKLANTTPFVFAQVYSLGITRDPSIFGAYSYDEAENQYLIFPFDYFAIDIVIRYRVPFACVTPVTSDPNPCLH